MEKQNKMQSTYETEVKKLQFYGGWIGAAIPMIFFVAWAIGLCLYCSQKGAPDENGLILGAVLGIVAGLFLVKDKWEKYCRAIFDGMSQPIGIIAVVCWIWAGMFANVLKSGELVKGLVWLGTESGCQGSVFTAVTFVLSAIFATAVGTGYGTTIAFCTLMYPVGIILGSHPVILFGAILSGAAFGDNLAPVSDTTIVSAVTQETDVPGVVRSRFKYAITAAVPTLLLFLIFGGASAIGNVPKEELAKFIKAARPDGLLLLIPFALVIFLALRGFHLIISITWGIIVAVFFIILFNLAPASVILSIDLHLNDGNAPEMTGALIDGIAGFIKLSILILFVVAAGYIMKVGGALESIKKYILKLVGKRVWGAELAIFFSVCIMNFFITVNTAAEISAAPFVKDIGKSFKIHPYRRANFLDALSSALGYIFPWSGGVLIGVYTLNKLAQEHTWLSNISPTQVYPYVFHGWFLIAVLFIAAITGFGRRYEGPDGKPVKKLEK